MKAAIFPGWWQVAVAITIQAVYSAAIYSGYSVVAMPLQHAFQPSRVVLMLGITVTSLVGGALTPFLGAAMDRYSLRIIMLIGASLLPAGFLALSFATSMTYVVSVYAIFMAVASVLLGPVASSALLARWFTRRRGLAMGIAAAGSTLGSLILPPLLQGLIDHFDWRTAFRIFAGILFAIAVPVIAFVAVNRPSDRNLFPDGDGPPSEASAEFGQGHFRTTISVLRDPNFWFISVILGLVLSSASAVGSNLLPIAIGKGITADRGALLISVLSAGAFTGKMVFAGVGDRIDLRLLLAIAMLVLATGMLGFLQADGYAMLVAATLLTGLSGGTVVPLWGYLLARAFGPENIGRVMGLMNFVVLPVTIGAPPLFGWVYDKTGSYNNAFILYMALLPALAIVLLPRIRTQPATPATKAA